MSKIYKEDVIVFGKCLCIWCGSSFDLIHINISPVRKDKKPESYDTVICLECFRDIPDNNEREDIFESLINDPNNDEREYDY
jgi:hypothetical protein